MAWGVALERHTHVYRLPGTSNGPCSALPEPDLNSLSHRLIDAAVLEFGPTEIFPPVGAMHRAIPISPDRAAPAGPTHPRKAGFSPWEGKIARDADSPLEGTGFEPSVPRCARDVGAAMLAPDLRDARQRPLAA